MKLSLKRKISKAMKASWRRRRADKGVLLNLDVPETVEEYNRNNAVESSDQFRQLEQLAATWKALETHKWQIQGVPQLEPIIEGAITSIRWEIILLCQQMITDQPRHTLD